MCRETLPSFFPQLKKGRMNVERGREGRRKGEGKEYYKISDGFFIPFLFPLADAESSLSVPCACLFGCE